MKTAKLLLFPAIYADFSESSEGRNELFNETNLFVVCHIWKHHANVWFVYYVHIGAKVNHISAISMIPA